ncbi:MAG: hypothetical protein ACRDXB_01210 [Actinomycetes bacterium]
MALWMTELPGGGYAMGEAEDEAEARLMIESQQRGSVVFNERTGRYRWTVVLDGGKTSHGWADTPDLAWWFVKEALNRPHRGVRNVVKTRRGTILE